MAKRKIVNTLPVAGPQENPVQVSTCIAREIVRHDIVAFPALSVIADIEVPEDVNLARVTIGAGAERLHICAVSVPVPVDDVEAITGGLPYVISASSALVEVLEVYPGGRFILASDGDPDVCSITFVRGLTT